MKIRIGSFFASLALLGLLSSCTATAPQGEIGGGQSLYLATADSPPPSNSGLSADAAFDGVLAISETGCFGYSGGGPVVTLAFPLGTTILPTGDGVTLPSGHTIEVGDALVGGGGAVQQDELQGVTIPEACAGDEIIGMELE